MIAGRKVIGAAHFGHWLPSSPAPHVQFVRHSGAIGLGLGDEWRSRLLLGE